MSMIATTAGALTSRATVGSSASATPPPDSANKSDGKIEVFGRRVDWAPIAVGGVWLGAATTTTAFLELSQGGTRRIPVSPGSLALVAGAALVGAAGGAFIAGRLFGTDA
jgi:hypothetical protein